GTDREGARGVRQPAAPNAPGYEPQDRVSAAPGRRPRSLQGQQAIALGHPELDRSDRVTLLSLGLVGGVEESREVLGAIGGIPTVPGAQRDRSQPGDSLDDGAERWLREQGPKHRPPSQGAAWRGTDST